MENEAAYKTYPYRWVVLFLFMIVNITTIMIWLTYAAIQPDAASVLTSGDQNLIALLALSSFIVYLFMNFPACWCLDKFGLKWGTGIGVIFIGIFGFLRALYLNYTFILLFQFLAMIGQAFVENSFTKVAVNWFPQKDKALATGLGTMSMILGVVLSMFLSGPIFLAFGGGAAGLYWLGMIYGIIALGGMILYMLFVKDKPPTPANESSNKVKILMTQGLRDLFKNRVFIYLLLVTLVGLGLVGALLSEISEIVPSTFTPIQVGIIPGILFLSGIVGCVIIPAISDKVQKRKVFLIISIAAAIPFTILFGLINSFPGLEIESIFYGFLLVPALPIGLTYAAEITFPVPEEASNGMLMWVGQIGGIVYILIFFIIPPLDVLIIITACFGVCLVLMATAHDVGYYKKTQASDKSGIILMPEESN
jgi:MFS family permease